MGYPKARVDERVGDDGVPSQPSFPKQEDSVLAYWAKDGTFQASIDARPAGKNGANEFVFYDGPPFANGLPHYGHLLTGYVKDLVPRYQTMLGRHVERRFGNLASIPGLLGALPKFVRGLPRVRRHVGAKICLYHAHRIAKTTEKSDG